MSEYDDNEIDEGASLTLALEAVRQQSDQWQKYENLKEEIIDFEQRKAARIERQSQSFSQPVIHSHADMAGFPVRNIRLGIGRQKTELESLESGFRKMLADLLEAGQFIAFGKVGGFSEPFRLIEPNYWQGMNIVNFERSIVRERTQAQTEWLEVRIFAKGEEPQPNNTVVENRNVLAKQQKPTLPKPDGIKTVLRDAEKKFPDEFEEYYRSDNLRKSLSEKLYGELGSGHAVSTIAKNLTPMRDIWRAKKGLKSRCNI